MLRKKYKSILKKENDFEMISFFELPPLSSTDMCQDGF